MLAIRKDWIDWQTGDLLIPAEVRKGGDADASYRLHRETLTELKLIANNDSDLLFYWPGKRDALYEGYRRIRKKAGLATDRKKPRSIGFQVCRFAPASKLATTPRTALAISRRT